jgi:hypothetical protein
MCLGMILSSEREVCESLIAGFFLCLLLFAIGFHCLVKIGHGKVEDGDWDGGIEKEEASLEDGIVLIKIVETDFFVSNLYLNFL